MMDAIEAKSEQAAQTLRLHKVWAVLEALLSQLEGRAILPAKELRELREQLNQPIRWPQRGE